MRSALEITKLTAVYDLVARRYDIQHALLTGRSDQRGRNLLIEKAVAPGNRVLDCGAGTGSTGLLAARKTGASGGVVLFDISEGMLAVARKRAAEDRMLERMEFQSGDLLDLPFPDNSFDAVLSTYSLCPVYDPVKAARELWRVTRPGGRIGIAHSADPDTRILKWLADRVENIVWRFPSLSLGCRSITVLPALEELGCKVVFKQRIGVPLWPFLVFVTTKSAP